MPLYISENHLGFFFAEFGKVSSVKPIKSKAGITTSDVEINYYQKYLIEIPSILI